jgi:hypothetical protein
MLAGTIEYPRKTVAKPANIILIAFSCAVSVLVVALVATIIGKSKNCVRMYLIGKPLV